MAVPSRWDELVAVLKSPLDLVERSLIRYRLSFPYPTRGPQEPLGAYGERLAALLLERKGYLILERSFRTKTGEIDLIASFKSRTIVFVEVKAWENYAEDGSGPSDRVDEKKQKKITDTALRYYKQHRLWGTRGRADVIEVIQNGPEGVPVLRHFENAFEAVGQFQMFS
ncbi:MAG: YraN family protein [Pirellula sp.]|jgi:putative endonuclease|nr:YraN family protein [Pirellula sp.]